MKYCTKCGKENRLDARYCDRCGTFLAAGGALFIFRRLLLWLLLLIALAGSSFDLFRSGLWTKLPFAAPPPAAPAAAPGPTVVAGFIQADQPSLTPPTQTAVTIFRSVWVRATAVPAAPQVHGKQAHQKAEEHPALAVPTATPLPGMVLIPAGKFMMGMPEGMGLPSEHPQHPVTVKAFFMDKYLVTFDEYDRFCQATGRTPPDDLHFGRGSRPVLGISWDDANAYAHWAGKRLPTEAEYEWAARGGADTLYFFGDDGRGLGDYAWYNDNSGNQTHPVGEKKPNPYGLYDILGNVDEWCSDWYGDSYYSASPGQDPPGPKTGTERVVRGGSWWGAADFLLCARRNAANPDGSLNQNGFRCVKTP